MFNLDEAIRHAEEVAESKKTESETAEIQGCDRYALKCEECASEHRQLAEWLKDYKRLKEQTEITWVAGADGAKVAFLDVPIPKVLKICEILQEPTVTSTEDSGEMTYPQVEDITPTVVLDVPDTNVGDIIRREDALKQCGWGMTSLLIADCIRRLPSVKPQPTGHWVMRHRKVNTINYHTGEDVLTGEIHTVKELIRYECDEPYCSECGKRAGDTSGNYCCFCGARMESEG